MDKKTPPLDSMEIHGRIKNFKLRVVLGGTYYMIIEAL